MNPMPLRVLIVEDEPKLAALLADYLRQSGYQTETIGDGLAVLPWLRANKADLVLLDLMLPGRDGIDILREVRTFSSLPVIMVTARVEEIDRLLGLELGADDYICKPFSPREVVARVKAVLRRGKAEAEAAREFIHLDPERFEAFVAGKALTLTRTEFNLLQRLSAHPGRVYSRDQLLDTIYDDHRVVSERTVDSHVKNLRRKLGEAAPECDPIQSVYGVGYKFEL
jgi:two-component system response regulator BaeR